MWVSLAVILLQVTAHAQDICLFDSSLFNTQYWKAFKDKAYRYDVFTVDRINTFEQIADITQLEEQWRCVQSETGLEFGHQHYRYIVKRIDRSNFECREYINAPPNGLLLKRIIAGGTQPSMDKCKMNLLAESSWDVMLKYEQGIPHVASCPWPGGDFATVIESTAARCQSVPAIISRVEGSHFTIGDCDIRDKADRLISGNFFCITSWGGATVNPTTSTRDMYVAVYQFDDSKQRPAFYVGRYRDTSGGNITMSLKAPDDYTASFDIRLPATFVNEDHFRIDLHRFTTITTPPTTTTTIRTTTRRGQGTTRRAPGTTRRAPGTTRRPSVDQPCDPSQNPCLNGGTCTATGACDCRKGTAGRLCQIDIPLTTTARLPISRQNTRTHGRPSTAPRQTTARYSPPCTATGRPCVNGGTCSPVNKCECPRGYRGNTCELIDPGGTGTGNNTGVSTKRDSGTFTTPVLRVEGGREESTTSTTSRSPSPGDPTTTTKLTPTAAEPFNSTALLFDENEERRVFIILITFCVSFAALSTVLCIVACCRRQRPIFGGDKRSDTLPVSPPSVNGKDDMKGRAVQQAWYPHYRSNREAEGIDVINTSVHSLEIQ